MSHFLFFRFWPGFRAPFPFDQFNGLSEAEILPALDEYARELFQEQRELIKDKLRARRKKVNKRKADTRRQVKLRQRRTVTAPPNGGDRLPFSGRIDVPELTIEDIEQDIPGSEPLICRVGSVLGFYGGGLVDRAIVSQRLFVAELRDAAAAGLLVEGLQSHFDAWHEDAGENDHVQFLNPQFGCITEDGVSADRIRGAVNKSRSPKLRPRQKADFWFRHWLLIEDEVDDIVSTFVGDSPPGDVVHSDDFRSVRWFGEVYSFTANQAPVAKLLYENWQAGTPDVGDETLLLAVDPEAPPARLSTLFRDHPAWGALIVTGGTKGTHRFADRACNLE